MGAAVVARDRKRLAGAIAALVLVASGGTAEAATIGSDLKPAPSPFLGFGCGTAPCTVQQLRLPGNPHALKAPFSGKIRKWRIRTDGSETYDVRLRVLTRTRTGRWRFLRSSAYRTVPAVPGVNTFEARLRIRQGQRIALDLPSGDTSGMIAELGAAVANSWFPAPPDGATRAGDRSPGSEFLWNATVRRR